VTLRTLPSGQPTRMEDVDADSWSIDGGALIFRGPSAADPFSLVTAYGPTGWLKFASMGDP
jgi:hypothetical protein